MTDPQASGTAKPHDTRHYMTGFANEWATEAIAGTLPVGRNSPQEGGLRFFGSCRRRPFGGLSGAARWRARHGGGGGDQRRRGRFPAHHLSECGGNFARTQEALLRLLHEHLEDDGFQTGRQIGDQL